jgi:hypothetical protein
MGGPLVRVQARSQAKRFQHQEAFLLFAPALTVVAVWASRCELCGYLRPDIRVHGSTRKTTLSVPGVTRSTTLSAPVRQTSLLSGSELPLPKLNVAGSSSVARSNASSVLWRGWGGAGECGVVTAADEWRFSGWNLARAGATGARTRPASRRQDSAHSAALGLASAFKLQAPGNLSRPRGYPDRSRSRPP